MAPPSRSFAATSSNKKNRVDAALARAGLDDPRLPSEAGACRFSVTMRDPMGDMEAVEESIGKALTHVGEARGFVNAASDVQEKEDQ